MFRYSTGWRSIFDGARGKLKGSCNVMARHVIFIKIFQVDQTAILYHPKSHRSHLSGECGYQVRHSFLWLCQLLTAASNPHINTHHLPVYKSEATGSSSFLAPWQDKWSTGTGTKEGGGRVQASSSVQEACGVDVSSQISILFGQLSTLCWHTLLKALLKFGLNLLSKQIKMRATEEWL